MRKDSISILNAQLQKFQQLEARLCHRLKTAPEGSLHISKSGNKQKYYNSCGSNSGSSSHRTYLHIDQTDLIRTLAQKDYDKKLLQHITTQKRALQHFLKHYRPDCLKTVYASLSEERKKYVVPEEIDDESYAKNWESVSYSPGKWNPETAYYETLRGERVRSKTEKIIADTLFVAGIPYRYEYPLTLPDGRVWRPDFVILNKHAREEFILEHFGMMDNPDYCNNAISKLRIYAQNGYYLGINLLATFETRANPFSTNDLQIIIQQYLQ